MGVDRNDIPDKYLCELCEPRDVDKKRARELQMQKRKELASSECYMVAPHSKLILMEVFSCPQH